MARQTGLPWFLLAAVVLLAPALGAKEEKAPPPAPPGMILIPGGKFMMGVDPAEGEKPTNESPRHEVVLAPFYVDRFEVTNRRYAKFLKAKGYEKEEYWSKEGRAWLARSKRKRPRHWEELSKELGAQFPDHPVVGVSWYEAEAFARFEGKRLLTEAEWERAARYTDERLYPWGNDLEDGLREKPEGEKGKTYPVGANPADVTPEGVRDLGGNVSEWTASWFAPYPGTKARSRYWGQDAKRRLKVARGASWRFLYEGPRPAARKCRATYRLFMYPHDRGYSFIGIRLARSVPTPKK